jgi:hypothetical protein
MCPTRFAFSIRTNLFIIIMSRVWSDLDGVWIGSRICWRLIESNYSAIANSHTLQFTTAYTMSSQSAVSSPDVA